MLKALLFLSVLAVAPPGLSSAQEPVAAAAPSSETRAAIEAAETAWADALRAKDKAALEHLMAPEFHLAGIGDDRTVPRDLWLANLHRMDIQSYTAQVTGVRNVGESVVATVVGDWTVAMGGPAMQDHFELEDTWVRRDGGWQVTRRYRTNVPAPPPQ